MLAVFDPGVLVSAAITPRGVCGRILDAVLAGECQLVLSLALLGEVEEVLVRPHLARYIAATEAHAFVDGLRRLGDVYPDVDTVAPLTRDPDDDYLVSLARSVDADYLVSGDRDLLDMSDPSPPVLSPARSASVLTRESGDDAD